MIANKITITVTKTAVTLKDVTGRHTCHMVGTKKTVSVPSQTMLEESIILAVRTASCDNSIRPGVKISKSPDSDVYAVQSEYALYFVRPVTLNTFEVIMDESSGFQVVKGYKFIAKNVDNVTVFWMVDSTTKSRVGRYKYIVW